MSEHPDPLPDAEAHVDVEAEAVEGERVIYRDAEEFKEALDSASESIQKATGPDVLGNVIWWGLLTLLAFLYLAKPVFGSGVRHGLFPGVDLVRPVIVILAAIFIFHLVEIRNRHGLILRKRLCLQCGNPLLRVSVDEAGDGKCPKCEREFNLGEYRRPEENRGRQFRGYIDPDHFEKAVFGAAEQINKMRAVGCEADLMGWLWIGLGIGFGSRIIFDWDPFAFLPFYIPVYGIWFTVLLVWGAWYKARMKKLKPAIIAERLCMNCGFCLLHTPTNDEGLGRCPECGAEYTEAQYDATPG